MQCFGLAALESITCVSLLSKLRTFLMHRRSPSGNFLIFQWLRERFDVLDREQNASDRIKHFAVVLGVLPFAEVRRTPCDEARYSLPLHKFETCGSLDHCLCMRAFFDIQTVVPKSHAHVLHNSLRVDTIWSQQ